MVREAGQFKVQVDMGRCPAEAITVKTAGDKLVIRAETTRDSERILSKREFHVAIPKVGVTMHQISFYLVKQLTSPLCNRIMVGNIQGHYRTPAGAIMSSVKSIRRI